MKEKLLNNIKKLDVKLSTLKNIIISSLYATIVSLSITNGYLFLEEILLCGLIIGMSLLSKKTNI